MMKNIILITLFLSLGSYTAYAQERIVKGNIFAFKTYALNNVSVYAKKSKKRVVSDSLGNFSIECGKRDALFFNAAGFDSQTVKIKKNDSIDVNLVYKNNNASYNLILKNKHLKQKTLDYCIENLLGDNNNYDRMSSMFQIIQSIYPSAKITNNQLTNSNSGNQQIVLESRGVNSPNASRVALLVIDGVIVNSINNIDPSQVQSVKVLIGTDASHWGTRAANGVIEITTKH